MRFRDAIISSYKIGFKSSLFSLIIFFPLTLVAIQPYWPANILGWLVIVMFIVLFQVFWIAFQTYVDSRRNEQKQFSLFKILGVLLVVIPTALVLIVSLMKLLDYVKDNLFVVRL